MTTEVVIKINIDENLNLTEAENQIRELNLPKIAIEQYLYKSQTALCEPFAGKKNQRKDYSTHYYVSDKSKTINTEFGKIQFKQQRIRIKDKSEKIITPIQSIIERDPDEITIIDKECLILAKNTSYGKSKEILDFSKPDLNLSKTKIHEKANKTAKAVKNQHKKHIKREKYDVISTDGTCIHNISGKKHEVKVSIGFKAGSFKPQLLDVAVNVDWIKVNQNIKNHIKSETLLLSDGEKGISHNLEYEENGFQMCNRHFLDGLYYRFWQDGVGKNEAKNRVADFEKIIFKMKKQVEKYEQDDSYDLENKLDENFREITYLANKLFKEGFKHIYKFVMACKNNIFTYVKKALSGIYIKHMSNDIERTMLEVSRRAKKKGMHWSKQGAENLLYSMLLSYFDKRLFYQILDKIEVVEN